MAMKLSTMFKRAAQQIAEHQAHTIYHALNGSLIARAWFVEVLGAPEISPLFDTDRDIGRHQRVMALLLAHAIAKDQGS